ncbi:MAG: helix-turn-helix domain-containing protein [Myxococcales bacterium]|nr:helix-turn-helix domain-containing protein [Myxococcales bacterium]
MPDTNEQNSANEHISRVAFSLEEVGAMVGVHPRTVRRWAERGVIRMVRLGGRLVVPASELDRVLSQGADA